MVLVQGFTDYTYDILIAFLKLKILPYGKGRIGLKVDPIESSSFHYVE